MAMYLPPQGPVFDPPAIIMQAEQDLLKGPLAALMEKYAPPKAACYFNQESVDHGPAVRQAIIQQILLGVNPIAATYINSITNVSITISAGTSNTATITAVGANSFLIYKGQTTTGTAGISTDFGRIALTNSTTVTATLNSSGTITINCDVIDPKSTLVTGVQAGTITLTAATSNTASITSVSTTLSAVFYLGQSGTDTSTVYKNTNSTNVVLTSATVVTATCSSNSTNTLSFVVVTFAAGAINNIQQKSLTMSGTSTNSTITAVVLANTMIAWGNFANGSTNVTQAPWITLANTTTVTGAVNSSSTSIIKFTVIEFVSGVLNSVQRGSIAIAASTSNTATITSVVTAKSVVSYLGITGANGNDNVVETRLVLTNGTTVTANVNSAGSPTVGYEAVEFK